MLFEVLEECSNNHILKFDIHNKFSKRLEYEFDKKPIFSQSEVDEIKRVDNELLEFVRAENKMVLEQLKKALKDKLLNDFNLTCECGCHNPEGNPLQRCVHCCGEYIIDSVFAQYGLENVRQGINANHSEELGEIHTKTPKIEGSIPSKLDFPSEEDLENNTICSHCSGHADIIIPNKVKLCNICYRKYEVKE